LEFASSKLVILTVGLSLGETLVRNVYSYISIAFQKEE